MKKYVIIVVGLLFTWFTLDMTGFAIGKFILVVSCFIDDNPMDAVWWGIFIIVLILFIFKEKIGKYAMLVFLTIWAVLQGSMYFRTKEKIQSYYEFFHNEGTHRIIPTCDSFLVKDTYHIILDVLILVSLVFIIIFISKGFNKPKGIIQ